MQKAVERPFTITIKKDLFSGKPITFSGWRARVFAREMLESTIILNQTAREEKRETSRLLSAVVNSGEKLLAARPEEREAAMDLYKEKLSLFCLSCHVLHLKLAKERYTGTGLPEKAAQRLIIDEHLPNLLGKISAIGSLLHLDVSGNDLKKAGRWLHALKSGKAQVDALSEFLNNLATDSIWEIKSLAEHACTRAALHAAGVEFGENAKKDGAHRDPAPPIEG